MQCVGVTRFTRYHTADTSFSSWTQVFFYKRAQIFVADVYLCFQGQGLGAFSDIAQLTCFADYRLPQLMFHLGILSYDEQLKDCVLRKEVGAIDRGKNKGLV